ncbi:hypothetical protein [Fluviicola sp.]|uniref:hypothetical protein n=1 Tax=Fluviicola sp. TaxID=1917219 RepID=UPI0031CF3920
MFKIDSLIRGDWKLVRTVVNYQESREKKNEWLRITNDSLLLLSEHSKRFYPEPISNQYKYEVTKDHRPIPSHHLNVYHQKGKKISDNQYFDISFKSFHELVIRSESDLDEGIGTTRIHIVRVYERVGQQNPISRLLSTNAWYYCKDQAQEFLQLNASKELEFHTDSLLAGNCSSNSTILRFKNSMDELNFTLDQQSNQIIGFFSGEQKAVIDEQHQLLYLFFGNMILAYRVKELTEEKLILEQDNELTRRLNTQ